MTAFRRVVVEWWALISVIGGGLVMWGMFSARLDAAETTLKSLSTDHDLVVEMRTDLKYVSRKLDSIDKKVSELTDRAQ
jgi:hypothetical protein